MSAQIIVKLTPVRAPALIHSNSPKVSLLIFCVTELVKKNGRHCLLASVKKFCLQLIIQCMFIVSPSYMFDPVGFGFKLQLS